ncbi:MAG: metallophosphoesterase [Kiritimatiellales bacterium]
MIWMFAVMTFCAVCIAQGALVDFNSYPPGILFEESVSRTDPSSAKVSAKTKTLSLEENAFTLYGSTGELSTSQTGTLSYAFSILDDLDESYLQISSRRQASGGNPVAQVSSDSHFLLKDGQWQITFSAEKYSGVSGTVYLGLYGASAMSTAGGYSLSQLLNNPVVFSQIEINSSGEILVSRTASAGGSLEYWNGNSWTSARGTLGKIVLKNSSKYVATFGISQAGTISCDLRSIEDDQLCSVTYTTDDVGVRDNVRFSAGDIGNNTAFNWTLNVFSLSSGETFEQKTDSSFLFTVNAKESADVFRLVVFPDTQNYANHGWVDLLGNTGTRAPNAAIFPVMTDWIKEKKDDLKIKMVAHVGDIVNTDYAPEWDVASNAFATLDQSGIPYAACLGNHDMGVEVYAKKTETNTFSWATATIRNSLFRTYFPETRFQQHEWYGGSFSNSYYCYAEASGMNFLLLALDMQPGAAVLEWAKGIVDAHPDHRCIVVTHIYLRNYASGRDTRRGNYKVTENSGEDIWQKFITQCPNIFLVLCGHVSGAQDVIISDINQAGKPVHQILTDYSGLTKGGSGFMRVLTFHPRQSKITVSRYSPWLDAKTMTGMLKPADHPDPLYYKMTDE